MSSSNVDYFQLLKDLLAQVPGTEDRIKSLSHKQLEKLSDLAFYYQLSPTLSAAQCPDARSGKHFLKMFNVQVSNPRYLFQLKIKLGIVPEDMTVGNLEVGLYHAIFGGHINIVDIILPLKHNVSSKNCLEAAAQSGHETMFHYFILKGYKIEESNRLLLDAASGGNLAILRMVGQPTEDQARNIISYAVGSGKMDMVNYLSSLISDLTTVDWGESLDVAASANYIEAIKFVLPYATDKDMALFWAIANGKRESIKILVEAGVRLDDDKISDLGGTKDETVSYYFSLISDETN